MGRLQALARRAVFSLPVAMICLLLTFVAIPSVPEDVAKWGPVVRWIDGDAARWIVPSLGLLGIMFLLTLLVTGRSAGSGAITTAAAQVTPSERQSKAADERAAIHELLEELALAGLRLERAERLGEFDWDFSLPTSAYVEHKDELGSALREQVAAAYVRFDHLNAQVRPGFGPGDGTTVLGLHDVPVVIEAVGRAERALRKRLSKLGG